MDKTPTQAPGPAYRIRTPRLLLRCWAPRDAALLRAAVDVSLEHLRPWMPWARDEPETLQTMVARLRQWRAKFDLDQDFVYGVFGLDESEVLGSSGLHPRVGEGAREIGYWIRADRINQGLATEVAAALTKVDFQIDAVLRVEIHCDPRNVRSAAVARKLGFVHEATLRRRTRDGQGALRDTMIWTLLTDEYEAVSYTHLRAHET